LNGIAGSLEMLGRQMILGTWFGIHVALGAAAGVRHAASPFPYLVMSTLRQTTPCCVAASKRATASYETA
jgi:hypothetical protein